LETDVNKFMAKLFINNIMNTIQIQIELLQFV